MDRLPPTIVAVCLKSVQPMRWKLWRLSQIFKTVPKDASLRIYCPSDYLHKGITQWIHGWKKRNWRTASGGAVKNVEVWRALDEARQDRTVDWVWEDRKKSPAIVEDLDKVAKIALQKQR